MNNPPPHTHTCPRINSEDTGLKRERPARGPAESSWAWSWLRHENRLGREDQGGVGSESAQTGGLRSPRPSAVPAVGTFPGG